MARHVRMAAAVMCCAVLSLCATAHARQLLDNPFFGGHAGAAQSAAKSGTAGLGGIFGGGGGGSSTSQASAVSAAQAGSVLANRLGLAGSNAQCASNALAKSSSSGGGSASAQASSHSFAISGEGLDALADCGANAAAVASSLSCRHFIVPFAAELCALTTLINTDCGGLKLINPGVDDLVQGQTISLPPCSFSL